MRYAFSKLSDMWIVEEFDKHDNRIKATWSNGDIYEYEYDKNGNKIKETCGDGNVYEWKRDETGKCIRTSKNGKVIWEKKSKLDILIKKLEEYYDEVEYDENEDEFTLTEADGITSVIFFDYKRLAMHIPEDEISYVFPKALQLIEDYLKEEVK